MISVTGFIISDGCTILCEDCITPEEEKESLGIVNYLSGSTDCPQCCSNCFALIPTSLTLEGIEYVRNNINYSTPVGKVWNEVFGGLLK